jgi:tetratricopeptide (TPR) repeat protein
MRAARILAGTLALSVATTALLPAPTWAQQPAPAAASSNAALRVPVRSGVHPEYSRLVFDWPREVPYTVEQNGAGISIRFPVAAQIDLAGVLRARPTRINGLTQVAADGSVTVRFDIPAGAGIKHSRAGARIIVDVLDRPPPGSNRATASTPPVPPQQAAAAAPAPAQVTTAPATTAPTPTPRPADPRATREGAPLYQLRGNTAPSGTATASGAPTPLTVSPPPPPAAAANPPTATATQAAPVPAPATAAPTPVAPPPPPVQAAAAPPVAAPPAAGTPDAPPAETAIAPVTLSFDPKVARAAAIFERAGYLYILFDDTVPPETAPAVPAGLQSVIEPVAVPGGSGFRLSMPALMQASVGREGTAWQVMLGQATGAKVTNSSIIPRPDPDFALGPRLVVPAAEAEKVIAFKDPVVGDTLSVVPLPLPGQHVDAPLRYTEVQFLPTLQGLVIRPLDDRLAVQPARDGVEVTVPGGLRLSPPADIQAAVPPPPPPVEQEKLFDFKRWGQVAARDYNKTRQAKWDRLTALPDAEKTRGRLDIARFYLANGMGYEALGMLSRVQSLQPDVDRRPEFLAVRGIGRVLTGDFAGGMADLSNRQLASEPDAALWRAAALAGQGDYPGAHAAFQASKDLLDRYPEPFYTGLALSAADAALRAGQPEAAALIMDRVAKRGGESGDQAPAVQYFRGSVFRALGDNEKALSYFKQAQGGRDRLYAMRAKRDFIDTALAAGKMPPKEAAKKMEEMRFAWRGDALELSNLRRVGEVHAIAGNYPQAFDTMRNTISAFPDTPEAKEIAADMTRTFTDLFATDGAAKMTPLEAMGLYEQYRELTPPGPDGDRIIRKLAERLVEIDLLDRAGQLLDHQVQYRLQGLEKAQVGTRLAGLRLLDGNPEQAVAALDKSNVPEITPELAEERKLLRARALSQINKGADAVQLLAADQSRDANLLRIEIAMRDKQWKAAAQAMADVIGPPPAPGATLDPQISSMVVNRATALSLAGDNAGLEALRRDFGPAMDKSKDSAFFRLLTRPEESAGLADANTIRQRITEIDLFRSFLEKYRATRQEAATPPPAAAPAAPPATPPS